MSMGLFFWVKKKKSPFKCYMLTHCPYSLPLLTVLCTFPLIRQAGFVGYVICVAAEAVRIEYVFVSLFCQAFLFSPLFVSLILWQVFSFALCCFHFIYSGFCLSSWAFPCFSVVFWKYKEVNLRILRPNSAWMVSSRGMTASLYIVESEYEISPCFPVRKLVFSGPFVHQSNAPWLRDNSTFPLPWIQDNRKSMPSSNQSGLFTLWPVKKIYKKSVGKEKESQFIVFMSDTSCIHF